MPTPDIIEIRKLETPVHIGVPDEERGTPQTLWITLRMAPSQAFDGLADDIRNTIDYQQVATEVQRLAAAKPRRLIETLATDIARELLAKHPLASVWLRIEKKILPDTDCVAVEIERSR